MTTAPVTTARLTVTPLTGTLGALISGVDTAVTPDAETVGELRRALLRHKVVFLRDQGLDYDSQAALARTFGELTLGHPIYAAPENRPEVREIDSRQGTRANHWHTDLTFVDRPPAIAFLHNKIAPEYGGDTMWADTVAAYEALPEPLRALADRLRVVHSNDSDYTDATVAARREYVSTLFETEHPAVHVHPETGERALLLGGFARRAAGLAPQASRDVLRLLQEYVTIPEHTVRWRWRPGDLAIWDNRATQHYAVFDYGTRDRRAERCTVTGTVPVGVDGRPSTVLSGDTTAYSDGRS
ncbi:TauD/TfdA family dioxygenase [Streptomyces sp. NBC_01478]|uniref:TauD/TfdA dioxygenase family protein n=1 Tax=Streptomyces sp. NBC_01478 TaxID=2903882 RepID=UPI002E30514C|nr:TauD/TfdA family dioxygenase [Streptomyces sp. NBC_01478]